MRAFASTVTALSADELSVWRRSLAIVSPSTGERSEQRWEGEGGSLVAPKEEKR